MAFERRVLFSFSTKHLSKRDKVKFFYALKGRGKRKGLVSVTRSEHIGPGVLLVVPKAVSSVESFMDYWKCSHNSFQIDVEV